MGGVHRFSSEVHNHLQCVHIQVATVLKCQPLDLTSTCRHITVLDEVDVCCVICKPQMFNRGVCRGAVICEVGSSGGRKYPWGISHLLMLI